MKNKHLGLLLLLSLISCTGKDKEQPAGQQDNSKTFVINLSPADVLKDPLFVLDQERLKVLSLVFEPLLAYSSNGEIIPSLVAELPNLSADQLTYNFKLKAVNFRGGDSKGRAVTAKDVVHSLLRGVADDNSSNYGSLLTGLVAGLKENKVSPSGVQVKSDTEFSIRLLRKYPDFLALLTLPAFSVVPAEMIEGGKLKQAVGTGPYVFFDATVNGKNWDLSGDAALKFSEVRVTQSGDPKDVAGSDYSALPLKLATEVIDPATGKLDPPNHTLQELNLRRLEILIFNLRDPVIKALGPEFRRAVLSVLDTQSILATMYRGYSTNLLQFIPPGVEGALPEPALKMMDPAEARKKIAKALGPKVIKVKFPQSSAYWITEMQKNLEKLSANFSFEAVDPAAYLDQVEKGDFQLAPLSWEGDLPEASNFLQLYFGGSQNNAQNLSHYKSAAFDALFDKLSKLFPSPERKRLAEQAHKIVLRDLPAIPLGFKKEFCVVSTRAAGINTKAFGASALKDFLLAP